MIGTWLGRKPMEDVVDGTVYCARRQDRIDVERCFVCPMQRRLSVDEEGQVVAVACAQDARDWAGLLRS